MSSSSNAGRSYILSDYRLNRSLGRGNTSTVRLAIGPDDKQVAIKIPHPNILKEQESAERFGNEVRVTLHFKHPHLVRGYAGTAFGEHAFLAMQYFPEGPLSDRLNLLRRQREADALRITPLSEAESVGRVKPLSLDEMYVILRDIADGLCFIHHEKAVHQDVKTQNIYLKDGHAYLGDFGSTYFVAQGGKVSGSPFYMSPEIYHGSGSSSASDVYSFGVMTYELLADKRPFTGNTYEELMVSHLTSVPTALMRLNPQVPRELSQFVEGCLMKQAQDRPSMKEALHLLRKITGEEQAAPEAPRTEKAQGRHGVVAAPAESEPSSQKPAKAEKGGLWKFFQRKK